MRWVAALFLFIGTALATAAEATLSSPANGQQWRQESEKTGVKIYSRVRSGSALKEFKAIGLIEAPTRVVRNVIDDVEGYPHFMPFTAEVRIVKRDNDSVYAYQRISPKICGDRDYTLRIREKKWPAESGLVYLKQWQPANEVGPPEKKGVLRVKVCEGGWLLEPAGPNKTRATYSVYTDTGGYLPAFIANAASGTGIRKIFAAVRQRVKDSKYQEERDFVGNR